MFTVYDIARDPELRIVRMFMNCLDYIRDEEQHPNANIFEQLRTEFLHHESFTVVIDNENDKLVAFSGLYKKAFTGPIARVLNKTYYAPDYRSQGSHVKSQDRKERSWSTMYMLPFQLDVAANCPYIASVFISMEFSKRTRVFQNIIDWINVTLKESNLPYQFEMQSNLYNTCRRFNDEGRKLPINDHPGCWQLISWCHLITATGVTWDAGDALPYITKDEFETRFSYYHTIRDKK